MSKAVKSAFAFSPASSALPSTRSCPRWRAIYAPTRPMSSSRSTLTSSPSNRPPAYAGHVPINWFQRSLLVVGSAVTSLADTHRHDMVAVLSETTGGPFLARLRTKMRETPSGRRLLRDRPRITESSVNLDKLAAMPARSLGREYVDWLRRNKVTPDTRDPVRYIDDPELAYIMQRYRESHDFYHVMLGFGVSLPAELVVKWFELANFTLPVALLSSVFGPLAMKDSSERRRLMRTYAKWALECGGNATCLIGVEWEKCWERDIDELRRELGILKPPVPFKEWRAEGRRIKREKDAQKQQAEGAPQSA